MLISFFGNFGLGQVAPADQCSDNLLRVASLSYYDDLQALPSPVKARLSRAVQLIDPTKLPVLTPYLQRADEGKILR